MEKIHQDNLFSILEREDVETEDDWLIHSLIPRSGRVFIYGHGGLGKSRIVYDLAVAVVNRTPFLGTHKTIKQFSCLIVAGEGSMSKNRQRLKWACRSHGMKTMHPDDYRCNDLRIVYHSFLLDKKDDAGKFLDLLAPEKINVPKLIVLDPLDSFFIGDENQVRDTKPFRHNLDKIIEATQSTFVLVHHASKGSSDDKIQKRTMLRGSSAWFGWADTVIRVDKQEDNLLLIVEKQRNGPSSFTFEVKPVYNTDNKVMFFRSVTGPVFEHSNQVRDASVELQWGYDAATYQAIRQEPDRNAKSIMKLLGLSNRRQLQRSINSLGSSIKESNYGRIRQFSPTELPPNIFPLKYFHELMPELEQLTTSDAIDIDYDEEDKEDEDLDKDSSPN